MTIKQSHWPWIILLLIAAGARLIALGHAPLGPDEAIQAVAALDIPRGISNAATACMASSGPSGACPSAIKRAPAAMRSKMIQGQCDCFIVIQTPQYSLFVLRKVISPSGKLNMALTG